MREVRGFCKGGGILIGHLFTRSRILCSCLLLEWLSISLPTRLSDDGLPDSYIFVSTRLPDSVRKRFNAELQEGF